MESRVSREGAGCAPGAGPGRGSAVCVPQQCLGSRGASAAGAGLGRFALGAAFRCPARLSRSTVSPTAVGCLCKYVFPPGLLVSFHVFMGADFSWLLKPCARNGGAAVRPRRIGVGAIRPQLVQYYTYTRPYISSRCASRAAAPGDKQPARNYFGSEKLIRVGIGFPSGCQVGSGACPGPVRTPDRPLLCLKAASAV